MAQAILAQAILAQAFFALKTLATFKRTSYCNVLTPFFMFLCDGAGVSWVWCLLVVAAPLLCFWFYWRCSEYAYDKNSRILDPNRRHTICLHDLLFPHEGDMLQGSGSTCMSRRIEIHLYSALFGHMHDLHTQGSSLKAMQALIDCQNATIVWLAGEIEK